MTINDGLVACRGRGSIDRCMLPLILQFLKVEIVAVGKGDVVDSEISVIIGGPVMVDPTIVTNGSVACAT